MRNAVILAAVLMMATGANGQTPAAELKVGDRPRTSACRRPTARPTSCRISRARRPSSSPGSPRPTRAAARSSASHSPRTATRSASSTSPTSWRVSTRSRTTRDSPRRKRRTSRLLSDPTKATATAYGVLSPGRASRGAGRIYIGKDGKILGIDKAVTPKSSAEDMVAKLTEYGVEAAEVERTARQAQVRGLVAPKLVLPSASAKAERSLSRRASATTSPSRTADRPSRRRQSRSGRRCPTASRGSSNPDRSIHPITSPVFGEIRAMREVCQTLARISPLTNSSSFSFETGTPLSRTVTRPVSLNDAGSRKRRAADPSLMMRRVPSCVRPHPSPV